MSTTLRIVEKLANNVWEPCRMKELNIGDEFRMFENGEPLMDGKVWTVTSAPYEMVNEHGVQTWGVNAEEKE